MDKSEILKRLEDCGVVAVVRAESAEQAMKIADACIAGGVKGIEITYTVPGASEIISELAKKYTPDQMIIGAGTVLDPETARSAIMAGANYVDGRHHARPSLRSHGLEWARILGHRHGRLHRQFGRRVRG